MSRKIKILGKLNMAPGTWDSVRPRSIVAMNVTAELDHGVLGEGWTSIYRSVWCCCLLTFASDMSEQGCGTAYYTQTSDPQ